MVRPYAPTTRPVGQVVAVNTIWRLGAGPVRSLQSVGPPAVLLADHEPFVPLATTKMQKGWPAGSART